MKRPFRIQVLLFLVIAAMACCSMRAFLPAAATSAIYTENTTLCDDARHLPNTELEGLQLPGVTGAHAPVQKNATSFQHPIAGNLYEQNISGNFQIKTSSLLISDYLFYIYPTHNFW